MIFLFECDKIELRNWEEGTHIDKIIARAALRTLAAIGVLLAFMSLMLCLVFPSTMMYITYDLGMDGASVRYGMRAYRNTDDIRYCAFAMETAIGADKDEQIEYCGMKLASHENFALYCQMRDAKIDGEGLYKQYIYGQIALAQYRMGKREAALQTSLSALESGRFPENNAFFALALNALMAKDQAMVDMIKNQIPAISEGISDTDQAYLNQLIALLG